MTPAVPRAPTRSAGCACGPGRSCAATGPGHRAGPGRAGLDVDQAATRSVLDDAGWLTTGDFGFVDIDGNLHLAGRANELYIRGGYNVYPAEVEDVLGRHPGVDAVCVLGLPDPVLGEVGVAVVVLTPGAPSDPDHLLSELRTLVTSTLADYKAPDRLVITDALPLTSMMKVDKRALAARLAESSVPPGRVGGRGPDERPIGAGHRRGDRRPRPARHHALHVGRASPRPRGRLQPLVRARPLLRRLSDRRLQLRRCSVRGHRRPQSPAPAAAGCGRSCRRPGGDSAAGSYLGVYYVLDGHHEEWNRWAVDQVNTLHAAGRMFEHRDHIHTGLYRFEWEYRRDEDGVPAELTLDHRFAGLVSVFVDAAEGQGAADVARFYREDLLPRLLPGTPVATALGFSPLPLLDDAPGDVPRAESSQERTLILFFVDEHPAASWPELLRRSGSSARAVGRRPGVVGVAVRGHRARHRHLR